MPRLKNVTEEALQPPHEELVINVLGQEFVESSYVQHAVGLTKFNKSVLR
jgi:hypothetical protein